MSNKIRLHTFNVAEMFNDSKGKTSLSKVCAAIIILCGCIIGMVGTFAEKSDHVLHSVTLTGIGAGLLGLRRATQDKAIDPKAMEVEPE